MVSAAPSPSSACPMVPSATSGGRDRQLAAQGLTPEDPRWDLSGSTSMPDMDHWLGPSARKIADVVVINDLDTVSGRPFPAVVALLRARARSTHEAIVVTVPEVRRRGRQGPPGGPTRSRRPDSAHAARRGRPGHHPGRRGGPRRPRPAARAGRDGHRRVPRELPPVRRPRQIGLAHRPRHDVAWAALRSAPYASASRGSCHDAFRPLGFGRSHTFDGPIRRSCGPTAARRSPVAGRGPIRRQA